MKDCPPGMKESGQKDGKSAMPFGKRDDKKKSKRSSRKFGRGGGR